MRRFVCQRRMAEALGVDVRTIQEWRREGCPFFKKKRRVRLSLEDVLEWLGYDWKPEQEG